VVLAARVGATGDVHADAADLGQTGVLPLLEAFRVEREIVVSAMTDLVAYQEALAEWNSLTGSTE
jgi:hypothetical protein